MAMPAPGLPGSRPVLRHRACASYWRFMMFPPLITLTGVRHPQPQLRPSSVLWARALAMMQAAA